MVAYVVALCACKRLAYGAEAQRVVAIQVRAGELLQKLLHFCCGRIELFSESFSGLCCRQKRVAPLLQSVFAACELHERLYAKVVLLVKIEFRGRERESLDRVVRQTPRHVPGVQQRAPNGAPRYPRGFEEEGYAEHLCCELDHDRATFAAPFGLLFEQVAKRCGVFFAVL